MEFKHYSVMLSETIDALCVKDGGIYADGTLGGGGHSYEILSRADNIRLIGIDQDQDAHKAASARLSEFGDKVTFVKDNFKNISKILDELKIEEIDGMVLDLGVSSYQLDNGDRGFSYMQSAPLDMRMNQNNEFSAYNVVNEYSEDQLTEIFYRYGELEILKDAVCDIIKRLKKGGRLAVITFHSLEDRIIKQVFTELAKGCTCPANFPVCVCGKKPEIKVITRTPVLPGKEELEENSRSKSAKLRVAEKL